MSRAAQWLFLCECSSQDEAVTTASSSGYTWNISKFLHEYSSSRFRHETDRNRGST